MIILNEERLMKEILNKNTHVDINMAFALKGIYEEYQYFIGFKNNEFYRINMEDEDTQDPMTLEELVNLALEYNDILEERYEEYGEYEELDKIKFYAGYLKELKKSCNSIPVWSMTYFTKHNETNISTYMFKSYKEMYDFYINSLNEEINYLYDEVNEENKNTISEEHSVNFDFVESYSIFIEDYGYYEHEMNLNVILIDGNDLQNI